MKGIVILYKDENSLYANEKVFGGKSARDLTLEWAKSISEKVVTIDYCKNVAELFSRISAACEENDCDYVVYSFDDLPFLNKELTDEIINTHIKYKAEYSFADGYSYGFSPEVLDKGTVSILKQLSNTVQIEDGNKSVQRDSIFSFIKKDINSYEIESVLADKDWRLLRYNFDCSTKDSFISCKELYKIYEPADSVSMLEEKASVNIKILKTVPGFYNIQIQDSCSGKCSYCPYPKAYEEKYGINPCISEKNMDLNQFVTILNKIKEFSGNAVISISAWGEPFDNSDILKYIEKVLGVPEFSLFIETDGYKISEDFCKKLDSILKKIPAHKGKYKPLMIAISLDGITDETYKNIRGNEYSIKDLVEKIKMLNSVIPGCVYPQFVRMEKNEQELEKFFRYWNEKCNESGGNFIIQKYNDFADLLPERKAADLSPLDRNVCWHLRRDMTILSNGDVPLCYQNLLDGIIGNVLNESLENIWNKYDEEISNHVIGKYCDKCRKCDEYYTYNF